MNQRWVWVVLCLTLLVAVAAGCAAQTQTTTVDKSAEPAPIPDGNVLDFPAPVVTPVSIQSSPSADAGPMETTVGGATPASSESPQSPSSGTSIPSPTYGMNATNNEKGYIMGHDVNLREGPGTQYAMIDTANYHTSVVITAKNDLWYCVECSNGQVGYMLKEFVGVGAIPTPTPTPKPTKKPTTKPTSTPKLTAEPVIEAGGEGDYTKEEVYLVAKLIYAEGKNQSEVSYLAMASVVYNRCNSSKFGGTIEQEVYRSNQFSVVKYDSFPDLIPSSAAYSAAKEVFYNGNRTIPAGVMYFQSASNGEYWSSSRTFYKTIGGNNYYY